MFEKTNDWSSMGTQKRNNALFWGRWDSCHLEAAFELDLGERKGFPRGSEGKESACSAEDQGSLPGSGRSPREGEGHSLQHSCLENPMSRGAWWATFLGVAELDMTERLTASLWRVGRVWAQPSQRLDAQECTAPGRAAGPACSGLHVDVAPPTAAATPSRELAGAAPGGTATPAVGRASPGSLGRGEGHLLPWALTLAPRVVFGVKTCRLGFGGPLPCHMPLIECQALQ